MDEYFVISVEGRVMLAYPCLFFCYSNTLFTVKVTFHNYN